VYSAFIYRKVKEKGEKTPCVHRQLQHEEILTGW